MNTQRLLTAIVLLGVAAVVSQTFSAATNNLVKKSQLGAAIPAKAAKAAAPSRGDYAILQVDPEGTGRAAGERSINELVFKLGPSGNSELAMKIQTLREELAKQETKPVETADLAVDQPKSVAKPDRCNQLRVSAVADNGAFISGRFREVGEVFVFASYPVRVVSTSPESASAVVECNSKERTLT